MLIEVVSIQVAGKQIKKPIDIPRPGKKGKSAPRRDPRQERPAAPAGPEVQESPKMPRTQGYDPGRDAAFKKGVSVLAGSIFTRG